MSAVATKQLETARAVRKPRARARLGGAVLPGYTAVVILYLMLPIFVMILFGFNNTQGKYNFVWEGFTLNWYQNLFAIPDLTTALINSLEIAAMATVLATIMGTMVGLALDRYRFPGKGAVNLVLVTNIAAPEVVLGSALLAMFVMLQIPQGIVTILLAHVMFTLAYVAVTVRARLAGFDRSLEEAAHDLGAPPWATFRKVTFPLIFPGVLAGGLLAFALSIDDYITTSFVAGQTVTFPLWVFGSTREGTPPQVNVMGTLIFTGGVLLAIINIALQRRGKRA